MGMILVGEERLSPPVALLRLAVESSLRSLDWYESARSGSAKSRRVSHTSGRYRSRGELTSGMLNLHGVVLHRARPSSRLHWLRLETRELSPRSRERLAGLIGRGIPRGKSRPPRQRQARPHRAKNERASTEEGEGRRRAEAKRTVSPRCGCRRGVEVVVGAAHLSKLSILASGKPGEEEETSQLRRLAFRITIQSSQGIQTLLDFLLVTFRLHLTGDPLVPAAGLTSLRRRSSRSSSAEKG